jgi:hypothetical protein
MAHQVTESFREYKSINLHTSPCIHQWEEVSEIQYLHDWKWYNLRIWKDIIAYFLKDEETGQIKMSVLT